MAVTREKWEYCRLEDSMGSGFVAAKLVFFTTDGEKTESLEASEDSSQRDIIAMRIARLGDEGWEMAGTGVSGQGSHAIYFRRRKS